MRGRNTQLEETISLKNKVIEVLCSEDYAPFLLESMLRIKVEDSSYLELIVWLFQVHSDYQNNKSYEVINARSTQCLRKELNALCDEAMHWRYRALW